MIRPRPTNLPAVSIALLLSTAACFAQPQAILERAARAGMEAGAALMQPDALRVFMCGTASPLGADPSREQACVAVLAGGKVFLVDVGAGSPMNLGLSNIPMGRLEAVLLTHFHSDHISALADVNLNSWVAGRAKALRVIGPEGVDRVVAGFNQAYGLDRQYRVAHHGEELLPPDRGPMQAEPVDPGVIYDADGVRIQAFLVDHEPISPAYGYRFDYGGRSVVISGDSIRTPALTEAAKGADLLLHDAMAKDFVNTLVAVREKTGPPAMVTILKDIQTYHAPTTDVFALAEEAKVKKLVLYHLVPAFPNAMVMRQFTQGAPEGTVLAADGMLFVLPKDSEEIEQKQLFER